ncbi:hypothetical protein [Haloferula sp. BvORR071]|uniref:hypothetical protein n=1 Tax=Haloferula sp. BvORR071 TaxID=1396141 RepID=UPI00054F11D1|nr:hypothetical protein [Haloferula sp. BvORR071]
MIRSAKLAVMTGIPAVVAAGIGIWLCFSPGSRLPGGASTGQNRTQRFTGSTPKNPSPATGDWEGVPLSADSLRKLPRTTLTPESARQLLDRAKTEITGIESRAEFSAGVLSTLAKQGHLAEAWALVEAAPGMVRERQLATLFREDPAPLASLVAKLEGLRSPKERGEALQAIIGSRPRDAAGFDLDQIRLQSPQEMRAFSDGISEAIAGSKRQDPKDCETPEILLKKCIALAGKGTLDYGHFVHILNLDSSNDGFLKWELLAGLKNSQMTADQVANLQSFVAGQMVNSDAERAMAFLCSGASNPADPSVLASAISGWYGRDSRAARAWITGHAENLAPAAGDGIKSGVAQLSLERGEFSTAREWAALIGDRASREALKEKIRAAETTSTGEGR